MIIDQSIKDEVKQQAKQIALTEQCPSCTAVGMRVGKVYTELHFTKATIPKGQEKPTVVDVEDPFGCPVEMICPQCGSRWTMPVESHN